MIHWDSVVTVASSISPVSMAALLPRPSPSISFFNCDRPNPTFFKPIITKSRTRSSTRNSSPRTTPKLIPCPSLDRHASAHHRLRFVRKLTTLLLSKPRHFLPLRVLSRCRPYLTLPPSRPLLPMILRYPTLFRLLRTPSPTNPLSSSHLSVSLTPAALSLFLPPNPNPNPNSPLSLKLQKLLLLSPHRRLLLSKLVHLAPDLGLPPNFRSRLCNSCPHLFHTLDTSYGRALQLVSPYPSTLTNPLPSVQNPNQPPIIDRPPKFTKLKLRRGLNVKRKHLDWLVKFGELPEVNPYLTGFDEVREMGLEMAERRACAVVREVLGMTVEKRTLVDHLTHFRKEFGLPNRLRAMLVRHPEMFYVSVKGDRDSVFLVEAYDDKGRLVMVEEEMLRVKEGLEELVREGKRIRREERRGVGMVGGERDEESEEDEEYYEDDDGLRDLFETGIGDDWEEFDEGEGGDLGGKRIVEYWSLKDGGGEKIEAW